MFNDRYVPLFLSDGSLWFPGCTRITTLIPLSIFSSYVAVCLSAVCSSESIGFVNISVSWTTWPATTSSSTRNGEKFYVSMINTISNNRCIFDIMKHDLKNLCVIKNTTLPQKLHPQGRKMYVVLVYRKAGFAFYLKSFLSLTILVPFRRIS